MNSPIAESGNFTVPIGCDDDTSCVVTLLLTALGAGGGQSAHIATVARAQPKKPVVVGKKTVTIKARKRKTVRLTLNRTGRKLLAKNHKLKVTAQITERGHRTRTLKITFKPTQALGNERGSRGGPAHRGR